MPDTVDDGLIGALPDAVLVAGRDGRTRYANAAAARLFGRSVEELCALPPSLPSELGSAQEVTVLRPGGQRVTAEMSAARIAWRGAPAYLISLRDVTARKAAERAAALGERRSALLLGAVGGWMCVYLPAEDGLWHMLRLHGPVLEAGAAAALPPLTDAPADLEILSVFADVLDAATVETVLRTGRASRVFDVDGADGKTRWVQRDLARIEGVESDAPEIVGIALEVTERHAMQERLLAMQKMEALGDLSAKLAHHLNNMLAVMVGNVERVQSAAGANPLVQRACREALGAAERAAGVTAAMLAVGRRENLRPERWDLNDFVREMQPVLERTARDGLQVALQLHDGDLPLEVDRAKAEHALLNLALNAAEAVPAGRSPARLVLRTGVQALEAGNGYALARGRYAVLEAIDNGAGMNEEVLAKALEPFFTTRSAASGLGLSVVFGFAKQHGGHLEIESRVGEGTCVRLLLPTVETGRVTAPLGWRVSGARALVVDDEPAFCDLGAGWLRAVGFECVSAGSADEALARLAAEPFDLVFTDVVMPGTMDGVALAREVRQRRPHTAVLLTTGYADVLLAQHGELPGDVLRKPFRRDELLAAVRKLMARRGEPGSASPRPS